MVFFGKKFCIYTTLCKLSCLYRSLILVYKFKFYKCPNNFMISKLDALVFFKHSYRYYKNIFFIFKFLLTRNCAFQCTYIFCSNMNIVSFHSYMYLKNRAKKVKIMLVSEYFSDRYLEVTTYNIVQAERNGFR